MSTPFHNCTLCASLRSPFARRVRLALLENGIPYEEKIFDVFKPTPDLIEANPLGRVPTAILKSGMTLVESHVILQALYGSLSSPLMPSEEADRLWTYHWSGLATGLADKIVEFYLEKQRPEDKRDPEIMDEFRTVRDRILNQLEAWLSRSAPKVTGPVYLGRTLTQADLDMGTSLAYLTLRDSAEWQTRFPHSAKYLENLDTRPSFKKTAPPA